MRSEVKAKAIMHNSTAWSESLLSPPPRPASRRVASAACPTWLRESRGLVTRASNSNFPGKQDGDLSLILNINKCEQLSFNFVR